MSDQCDPYYNGVNNIDSFGSTCSKCGKGLCSDCGTTPTWWWAKLNDWDYCKRDYQSNSGEDVTHGRLEPDKVKAWLMFNFSLGENEAESKTLDLLSTCEYGWMSSNV